MLTLQGAVAHCDMPLESGPTLYLPHSHKYAPGYLATTREAFVERIGSPPQPQLPMRKGDAIFFNPALFHAAGANTRAATRSASRTCCSSRRRSVARWKASTARPCAPRSTPELLRRRARRAARRSVDRGPARAPSPRARRYAFPVNLDRAPPVGGLAPPSQATSCLTRRAARVLPDELARALRAARRRSPHGRGLRVAKIKARRFRFYSPPAKAS